MLLTLQITTMKRYISKQLDWHYINQNGARVQQHFIRYLYDDYDCKTCTFKSCFQMEQTDKNGKHFKVLNLKILNTSNIPAYHTTLEDVDEIELIVTSEDEKYSYVTITQCNSENIYTNACRSDAMTHWVKYINEHDDMNSLTALDLFARDGSWQTSVLYNNISHLTAFELDTQFESGLKTNCPNATVKMCDSFVEIQRLKNENILFDIVVVDNGMGIYSDKCEHFEIIDDAYSITKKWLIFNVKIKVYGQNDEWNSRRDAFYGSKMENIEQFLSFYKARFKTEDITFVERKQEKGLYSFCCKKVSV